MKCTIQGCPGSYEDRFIVHTVKQKNRVLVFEDVPAQVCDICSDTLLAPSTIRNLEQMIKLKSEPKKHAPVYSYA